MSTEMNNEVTAKIVLELVDRASNRLITVQKNVQALAQSFKSLTAFNFDFSSIDSVKTTVEKFKDTVESAGGDIAVHATVTTDTSGLDQQKRKAKDVGTEIEKNKKKQDDHNKSIREGIGKYTSMFKKIGTVGLALVGISAAGAAANFLNYSSEISNIQSRLDSLNLNKATESSDEFFRKIVQSSNRSFADITQSAKAVANMINANETLFGSNDSVIRWTESLNKMFVVGGVSKTQQESVMYNLGQAMSKGFLGGDDLNRVQENLPQLIHIIEDEMGWKRGSGKAEIQAMGGFDISEMISIVQKNSDVIDGLFENMDITLEDWRVRFKNKFLEATIIPATKKLTDFLNTDRFKKFFFEFTDGLAKITEALIPVFDLFFNIFNYVVDHWSLFKPLFVAAALGIGTMTVAMSIYSVVAGIAAAETLAIMSPFLLFGALIAGVTLGIYGVVHALNQVMDAGSATGFILGTVAVFITGILTLVQLATNVLVSHFELMANYAKNPIYSIYKKFESTFSQIYGLLESFGLASVVDEIMTEIYDIMDTTFVKIVNVFIDGINAILGAFNMLKGVSNELFGTKFGQSNLINTLKTGDTKRAAETALSAFNLDKPEDYIDFGQFKLASVSGAYDWAYETGSKLDGYATDILDAENKEGGGTRNENSSDALSNKATTGSSGGRSSGRASASRGGSSSFGFLKNYETREVINNAAPISIVINMENTINTDEDIEKTIRKLEDSINTVSPRIAKQVGAWA